MVVSPACKDRNYHKTTIQFNLDVNQGYGSGSWKRKLEAVRRLNCCGSGSTLKKEAGSGSKLGSD